jgi:hypothetical protein
MRQSRARGQKKCEQREQKKTISGQINMAQPVIKIENLSKVYRLGEIGTGTLSHCLSRFIGNLNRFWKMNPRLSSSKLLIKQRSTKTGQAILGQDDPYAMIGQCKTQHPNDK